MAGPEDVLDERDEQFIESENMREEGASPYCFLDSKRACNASCMAYVTYPKVAKTSDLSPEQAHCAVVNNAERVGRGVIMVGQSVTEVAVTLKSFIARAKNAENDRARTTQLGTMPNVSMSPFGGGKKE
jgi:hypothetical protein